ncbi:glycosyltransferase family 4 protein [Shewanella algicola]|uniref:glycosyltransferase family 4 protein n=1 Tax=Shewanella algicola TaxID=640633 RepID=UPI0024942544|nr:glycosyltransferase family 4 protein [Shewanella algicola]
MNILIVSQYFWPEFLILNELVEDFVADGHDVTVLTGEPNYGEKDLHSNFILNKEKFKFYKGCTIIRAPIILRGENKIQLVLNYISFAISACTYGLFKLRKNKFDFVFVFQSSPVTAALPAVIYRNLTSTPVILWVQDLWPDTLEAVGVVKNKRLLAIIGRLVSYIYNRSDVILCQSKGFIKSVKRYTNFQSKIDVLPNWSSTELINSKYEDLGLINTESSTFDVLFAGNIGEAQDFPTILACAKLLRSSNVRFLIVGSGSVLSWLRNEVAKEKLEDKIIIFGRYPIEKMKYFFTHSDALLVTLSKKEIFSLTIPSKVQAYMAFGKPIIASLDGVGAKVINSSKSGIATPSGDIEALFSSIMYLSKSSPDELNRYGQNGRHYYSENFDKNLVRNLLYKHVDSILKD